MKIVQGQNRAGVRLVQQGQWFVWVVIKSLHVLYWWVLPLGVYNRLHIRAIVESRDFKKWKFNFFPVKNNRMYTDEFWQNISRSLGDYKNAKTHQQCMSLTEKTEFPFFEIPIIRYCRRGQWHLDFQQVSLKTHLDLHWGQHTTVWKELGKGLHSFAQDSFTNSANTRW